MESLSIFVVYLLAVGIPISVILCYIYATRFVALRSRGTSWGHAVLLACPQEVSCLGQCLAAPLVGAIALLLAVLYAIWYLIYESISWIRRRLMVYELRRQRGEFLRLLEEADVVADGNGNDSCNDAATKRAVLASDCCPICFDSFAAIANGNAGGEDDGQKGIRRSIKRFPCSHVFCSACIDQLLVNSVDDPPPQPSSQLESAEDTEDHNRPSLSTSSSLDAESPAPHPSAMAASSSSRAAADDERTRAAEEGIASPSTTVFNTPTSHLSPRGDNEESTGNVQEEEEADPETPGAPGPEPAAALTPAPLAVLCPLCRRYISLPMLRAHAARDACVRAAEAGGQ